MDDLKLAFETIVVGVLAIPWLLILFHLVFYISTGKNLFSRLRAAVRESELSYALAGSFIVGIAYCLGTIIFPLADGLFNNDVEVAGVWIRNDDHIRTDVLSKVYFSDCYYKLSNEDFPPPVAAAAGFVLERAEDARKLVKLRKREEESRLSSRIVARFVSLVGREVEEPKPGESKPEEPKPSDGNEKGHKGFTAEDRKELVAKQHDLDGRFHVIYNHMKYAVYNAEGGYDILQPLHSRIVVLRGAVLNGILLLLSLVALTACSAGEMFYRALRQWLRGRRLKRPAEAHTDAPPAQPESGGEDGRKTAPDDKATASAPAQPGRPESGAEGQSEGEWREMRAYFKRRFLPAFFVLVVLDVTVYIFCVCGAIGVTEAEKEFDKNVVGLFYGLKGKGTEPPVVTPTPTPTDVAPPRLRPEGHTTRRVLKGAKEKASGAPTPDAYGHSRGLPQSFTRSQKERPLGETNTNLHARPFGCSLIASRRPFTYG